MLHRSGCVKRVGRYCPAVEAIETTIAATDVIVFPAEETCQFSGFCSSAMATATAPRKRKCRDGAVQEDFKRPATTATAEVM